MPNYPDRVTGPTPRGPGFAQTVVAPFAQSIAARGKFDMANQALDRRAMASAMINMNRLGVPGTGPSGGPTFNFMNQDYPITPSPADWSNELSRLKTKGQVPVGWQDFLKFGAAYNEAALLSGKEGKSMKDLMSDAKEMGMDLSHLQKPTTVEDLKKKKVNMKAPDGRIVDDMSAEEAIMAKQHGWVEVE